MENADLAEVRISWMGDVRERGSVREWQDTLKVLYGCTVLALFVPGTPRAEVLHKCRAARHSCEGKLADARRRRNAWEVDAHKHHLVGLDRELLRGSA